MPPTSSRIISISPVCSPLRTSISSGRTRSMIAEAQRTARAGPSKVARNPSPNVFTSRPRKRASSCDSVVVPTAQNTPVAVAKFGGTLRRADDVGEKYRRQHAVWLSSSSRPGQELLDLVDDAVGDITLAERIMIGSWQFNVFRTRDMSREVSSFLHSYTHVADALQHQSRHPDCRRMSRTSISLFIRSIVMAADRLAPCRSRRASSRR